MVFAMGMGGCILVISFCVIKIQIMQQTGTSRRNSIQPEKLADGIIIIGNIQTMLKSCCHDMVSIKLQFLNRIAFQQVRNDLIISQLRQFLFGTNGMQHSVTFFPTFSVTDSACFVKRNLNETSSNPKNSFGKKQRHPENGFGCLCKLQDILMFSVLCLCKKCLCSCKRHRT